MFVVIWSLKQQKKGEWNLYYAWISLTTFIRVKASSLSLYKDTVAKLIPCAHETKSNHKQFTNSYLVTIFVTNIKRTWNEQNKR